MGGTGLTEHRLESSLDGTLGFPIYFPFVFYGFIKAIMEAVYRWFHFSSTASVWLQYLLCQPRAYAFSTAATRLHVGAPTTHLRV